MNVSSSRGFILPIVLCAMLAAGILVGSALTLTLNATRTAGVHTTATRCRLSAQTALEREKAETQNAFLAYFRSSPATWNLLNWFDTFNAQSIGLAGFNNPLIQNTVIDGCAVSVALVSVVRAPLTAIRQTAEVTLQAVASQASPSGVSVTRVIQETVEYAMDRSSVFDYAYFVNNYGWFQGGGVTANGDIRANGDLELDGKSWVNGNAYAAANEELGSTGVIINDANYRSLSEYWSLNELRWRPTSPTCQDGASWPMGYDGSSSLNPRQEPLDMPFLGDLNIYREIAVNQGGTIKQKGTVLVNGFFSGTGPSGLNNGVDKGCLVLDGTVDPIKIDGPVVVDGDVIIKGFVSGQGSIYAGRNIHIVGDIVYTNPPSWRKPDSKPDQTVKNNEKKDMLGLAAKGNIVIGDYTKSDWLNSVQHYITPTFVHPYACDPTDASIGYNGTFSGDYTARDGGSQIKYVYNSKTKKYEPSSTSPRTYYQSTIGDRLITQHTQSQSIKKIDAVLYNNHATMGRVGQCQFNGALVCRDEGIIYNTSVQFNWDIRLGSFSRDSVNIFLYLPMAPSRPRVLAWQEI